MNFTVEPLGANAPLLCLDQITSLIGKKEPVPVSALVDAATGQPCTWCKKKTTTWIRRDSVSHCVVCLLCSSSSDILGG